MDNRQKGEGSSRRILDFGQELGTNSVDYTGLLATLNNIDKDFTRDAMTKLLENIICKGSLRQPRQTRRRQPSKLLKRIRETRKALKGEN